MKIGIGIDDTICRTTEIVHDRLEKYAKEKNLNPLDIMNDDKLKNEFFDIYLEDIYSNAEVKRNAKEVIKRLRSKGNEIIIITARSDISIPADESVKDIINKWLNEKEIYVDAIIYAAYGETKAMVCKKLGIDLMIDDDPYNYKEITTLGINCLLFDDREKYQLRENYVTNWLDIEKYIERNR